MLPAYAPRRGRRLSGNTREGISQVPSNKKHGDVDPVVPDTGWTERLCFCLARCERRKRRWGFVIFHLGDFSSKQIQLYLQNMKIRPA